MNDDSIQQDDERSIALTDDQALAQRAEQQRLERGTRRRTPEELQQAVERLNEVLPCIPDAPELAAVHQMRFGGWLHGFSYSELGSIESVRDVDIRRSVLVHLMKVTPVDALLYRNIHTASRMHEKKGEKYFEAIDKLFTGQKGWVAADAAMKAFRKTVGLEGANSIIQVNVDNRRQSVSYGGQQDGGGPMSFEGMMDSVRKQLRADQAPPESPAVIDAELIADRADDPNKL